MVAVAKFTATAFSADTILGLVDYSLSEEATPLAPGDTSAATPQFTVTGIRGKKAHRTIGTEISLTTPSNEVALGTVTNVADTKNAEVAVWTADSTLNRLNAEVTALAFTTATGAPDIIDWHRLRTRQLFYYLAGLVGIDNANVLVDDDIAWHEAMTPGFKANLWDEIKKICTARGYAAWSTGTQIGFSRPDQFEVEIKVPESATLSSDGTSRAKSVIVNNYNHRLLTPQTDQVAWKADSVYSVAAGEIQEFTVDIAGSVSQVFDPTPVSGMDLVGRTGQYVVTGQDGYIVAPTYWADQDGDISVKIGDNPSQLVVTITGARDLARSPYRISEGSADRPALWIAGTGVAFDKQPVTIWTGDSTAPTVSQEIDNQYIGSQAQAFNRGVLSAQQLAGASQSLNLQGSPSVKITRKAWTEYNPAPNTLTGEQASCGAKNGIVQGWGSLPRVPLNYAAGSGIVLKVPATTGMLDVLHNLPVTSETGTFDKQVVYTHRAQTVMVGPNVLCSATFKLTRVSGTQVLKPVISWYDYSGTFESQTIGSTPTYVTGTETSVSVTATSPNTGTGTYHYAVVSLYAASVTAVDFTVAGAQFTVGSTATTVTAPVVHAAIPIVSFFGSLAGATTTFENNRYRIVQAAYKSTGYDLTLVDHVTIADFDAKWAGKTFADFDAATDPALTFGQYVTEVMA